MTLDQRIDSLTEEVATGSDELQKLKEAHQKNESAQSDINEKITTLGAEIKKHSIEVESLKRKIIPITKEHNDLQKVISSKEKLLKDAIREKEINSLFEQQPRFWDQLQIRMDQHQRELNDGIDIFEPVMASEKVAKKFQEMAANKGGFSELSIALRAGQGAYESYMKDICEKQLDGQTIPPSAKRERITILDRCLMNPAVESHWA